MALAHSDRILSLVFTDLAGSTALKTERGDRVGGELIEQHRTIVRRLAADGGGRIVDWAGDGCFLTFETPSAAVSFSLRLQLAHFEAPELPGVRVGIHMGEVSERSERQEGEPPRVEGLAVDLAARIAGLAQPGQVLMSAVVADSTATRIEGGSFPRALRWESYGGYVLKGIESPVEIREAGLVGIASFLAPTGGDKAPSAAPTPARRRAAAVALLALAIGGAWAVYALRPLGPAPDRPQAASEVAGVPDFGGRPAIAVLPFDNLSPDPEQAFFADGLSQDLITRLSTWRAFPVIARNSSFQYRGGDLDLKRVGADLGARYLVEGSVRRAGDRIRVTAQLIDAESAEHVWAETYERPVSDLFELQDEISSTIAASLVGDLQRAEGERARQQGTDNLAAWSLYQLGLQHADRYTSEAWSEAARLFARAAELDPHFATALGRLAMANWMIFTGDGATASDDEVAAALATARRGLELDPRDPVVHTALAAVYLTAGDVHNAVDSARRAVELNPSMPEAWIWLGWAKLQAGDPEACVVATERAQRLDPQRPMVWVYDSLALANWELRRYEASLEAARRLMALEPTYFTSYLYVAMSTVELGRMEEARAAIARGRRIRPDLSTEIMQNYLAVSRPEIDARRNAALRKAGLE